MPDPGGGGIDARAPGSRCTAAMPTPGLGRGRASIRWRRGEAGAKVDEEQTIAAPGRGCGAPAGRAPGPGRRAPFRRPRPGALAHRRALRPARVRGPFLRTGAGDGRPPGARPRIRAARPPDRQRLFGRLACGPASTRSTASRRNARCCCARPGAGDRILLPRAWQDALPARLRGTACARAARAWPASSGSGSFDRAAHAFSCVMSRRWPVPAC